MGGLIRFGWRLGNDRIAALAELLGNPHRRYAVIHVAGTKGKGSTTALSAGILQAQGFKVGSYFSPYVYDVRERIQVNGQPIPRSDFARLVTEVRPHIEAVATTELGQTTEFELKTIIGMLYFAERGVDYACIEVGIGGRLDATNIVSPIVTVITNIGLDHTELLGVTHAEIAGEKAGIIKSGIPCFTATARPDALSTIRRIALERNSPLALVRRDDTAKKTVDGTIVSWNVDPANDQFGPVTVITPSKTYSNLTMRMGGLYQRENAACAIAAVEEALERRGAPLQEESVRAGLASTALPGRLTVMRLADGPLVVMDGAHNPLAASALSQAIASLRQAHRIRHVRLVIGMVGGHSPDEVLSALAPGAELVVTCQPDWKRAQPAEVIARAARPYCADVRAVESVLDAARSALRGAGPDTLVLITGSFYTVGEVTPEALERAWAVRPSD